MQQFLCPDGLFSQKSEGTRDRICEFVFHSCTVKSVNSDDDDDDDDDEKEDNFGKNDNNDNDNKNMKLITSYKRMWNCALMLTILILGVHVCVPLLITALQGIVTH